MYLGGGCHAAPICWNGRLYMKTAVVPNDGSNPAAFLDLPLWHLNNKPVQIIGHFKLAGQT